MPSILSQALTFVVVALALGVRVAESQCTVSDPSYLQDEFCDGSEGNYNTLACSWDGGDCCPGAGGGGACGRACVGAIGARKLGWSESCVLEYVPETFPCVRLSDVAARCTLCATCHRPGYWCLDPSAENPYPKCVRSHVAVSSTWVHVTW